MDNKSIMNYKKQLFAVEYYKNGKNAAKAAEAVGYSKKTAAQRGHQLIKDETVIAYMRELDSFFSLDKMAAPDKETLENGIADIAELLEILTRIARRQETEDAVVVLKSESQDYIDGKKVTSKEENAQVVETRARLSDVNKAIDTLIKYYTRTGTDNNPDEGGVIILADVKEQGNG